MLIIVRNCDDGDCEWFALCFRIVASIQYVAKMYDNALAATGAIKLPLILLFLNFLISYRDIQIGCFKMSLKLHLILHK